MKQKCAIGIDGGATSTKVAVTTEHGDVLARAQGKCISPYLLDSAAVTSNFSALMDHVLREAGVGAGDIAGICLGVSGCDRPHEVAALEQMARAKFPGALAVATNDALVALVGGVGEVMGIITIAGTGSISLGINREGQTARAGGWGHLLGDEGSGYEIARQALVATLRAHDGRGPETELAQLILARLGLAEPGEIKTWTRQIDFDKAAIADLAPVVFEAGNRGDSVAKSIIETSGRELAECTCAVASRLWEPGMPITVVASGSVLLSQASLFDSFTSQVRERWANASVQRPKSDPAHGACTYVLHLLNPQDRVART